MLVDISKWNICVCVIQMTRDVLCLSYNNSVLSSLMIFHLIYNKSHTTGVTGGEGTAYPSGAIEFTPDI